MKDLRTLLQYKYIYITLTVIILIYSFYVTNYVEHKSKYDMNTSKVSGYIHDYNIDGNTLNITVIGKEKIIGTYYFDKNDEIFLFKETYKLGDYIHIDGTLVAPKGKQVFNLFDYRKYLLQNGIYYSISIDKIKKHKNNNRLIYDIKQKIVDRIDKIKKTRNYLYAFILGEDLYISDSVKESYQSNGISHLFAISGSNIAVLIFILMMLIKKVKIKFIIIFAFLYSYMFITNFCPSIVRAGIFFLLLYINKALKLNIKTINVLLLTLFVSLLVNPFLIYSVGFEFSFIISMYLILYKNMIIKNKSKIINLLIVSFIAFLASLPITLNNFYQINIFSIILNLIFVPYVSIIVFPLSLICFIFPCFDNILFFFTNIMESLSIIFSKINMLSFIIGKPSSLLTLFYYIIITITLSCVENKKYKYLVLIPIVILINYYSVAYKKYPEMIFINVGQGDSTLVRLPNNKGNILIDTGGVQEFYDEKWKKQNNKFSLGKDMIVPYLKSQGITDLEYLIITHGDYDHIGQSIDIINSIKVVNVLMNSNNINENEKKLIKLLKEKKIKYFFAKEGNVLNIKNYSFFVLNPHAQLNENDDSIILYFKFNNTKVLLMGDAGVKTEEYLINKYKLDIDIIKIGHHGSDTSSSKNFIKFITPRYAVISVGIKNKFNHPSNNVIKTLEKSRVKTFQTSKEGSIKFIFRQNDVTIFISGT